jgi:hypothetical protein
MEETVKTLDGSVVVLQTFSFYLYFFKKSKALTCDIVKI